MSLRRRVPAPAATPRGDLVWRGESLTVARSLIWGRGPLALLAGRRGALRYPSNRKYNLILPHQRVHRLDTPHDLLSLRFRPPYYLASCQGKTRNRHSAGTIS